MIEKAVLDKLNAVLDVPVYLETAQVVPGSYVVIEKTGSSVKNHIYSASFAVQSIAPSMFKASELNERVKAEMDKLAELPGITRSELETDYNFTNTKTKQYRYQAVYKITHYKEV